MAREFAVAVPLLLLTASCCAARDFYVGGRDGWTAKPTEPFNSWAERNRFQVNDRLRYSKEDSVLVVSQSHYDACNTTGPLLRLDGGDSVFVLGNSGPFFFISGDARRCQAGERLIVVVLAVRSRDNTPLGFPATAAQLAVVTTGAADFTSCSSPGSKLVASAASGCGEFFVGIAGTGTDTRNELDGVTTVAVVRVSLEGWCPDVLVIGGAIVLA